MNLREICFLCRGYRVSLATAACLGALWISCGSKKEIQPPPAPPQAAAIPGQTVPPEPPAAGSDSPYQALAEIESEYAALLEQLAGGELVEKEAFDAVGERLQRAAQQCAATEGGDPGRFLEATFRLLGQQNEALAGQVARFETITEQQESLDSAELPRG